MIHSKVTVVFCGEEYSVSPDTGLTIGRTGDVEVDDNPYLHRTFLVVSFENGFWWLSNTGSTLTATVADELTLPTPPRRRVAPSSSGRLTARSRTARRPPERPVRSGPPRRLRTPWCPWVP